MTSVTSLIKERIIERGKISFAEFMEMALYHPELGYYTSPRVTVGPEGDFYTSPATHPVFAALIAIQLDQMWRLLGSPKPFTLVEMGAGKGLLGREILAYVAHHSPALADAVQYVGLERRRMWAVKGQESWPKHPVSREADWGRLSANGITGCVVSNELLDALPTHKVVQKDGRLKEAYITLRDGRFVETVDELSTPLLETQLLDEGISLPEGHSTEVNLNLGLWVRDVAKRLQRGFVITFDYGYPARELYSPARAQGTIMTYYQHTYGTDPYLRIGEQDITSHVDFTAVILAGERNGLHFWGFLSQRDFLLNLGLDTFIEALALRGLSHNEYMANRLSMLELVHPQGLGGLRVLVQAKACGRANPFGLTPNNEKVKTLKASIQDLKVLLLGGEHIPLWSAKYPHAFIPEGLSAAPSGREDSK